jgi:hypothetical protein
MNQATLIGRRFSVSRSGGRGDASLGASVTNADAFGRSFFALHSDDAVSALEDHVGVRTCGAV